jgi:tRNA(Ile)-lysidine synthase
MPPKPALVRRVDRAIRRRNLLANGDRLAVAISGGPDSVALTWALRDLERGASWRLTGLIHVHHGLRGPEADQDEAFCRALAARLGLPIDVTHVDVRSRARGEKRSLEAVARELRYAALEAAAARLGASAVATGHTQDDQAETVLLRLLRGTGSRGVSAIRPRRGILVRPLIDCRRADVLADLAARGEPFREDRSNAELSIPRNRLRHTLMPLLGRDWPGSIAALARFAELAADDDRLMASLAREVAASLVQPGGSGVQMDQRGLNETPPALARRIVRDALETSGGTASLKDVEAVRTLARADKPSGRLDLHGVEVVRRGTILRIRPRQTAAVSGAAFEYPLSVPGEVTVPEAAVRIEAAFATAGQHFSGAAGPHPRRHGASALLRSSGLAVLQANSLQGPLVVRNRRPGDRFRPFGAPGSRKLQDLLVDRKIPRAERDRVPVVVDAKGHIVWVAGLATAEACRVTAPEAGVVILKMTKDTQ